MINTGMSKERQLALMRLERKMQRTLKELNAQVAEEFKVTPLDDRYTQGHMWGTLDAIQTMSYAWDVYGEPYSEEEYTELLGHNKRVEGDADAED